MNVRSVLNTFDFSAGMQKLVPCGGRGEGAQDVTFILGESQGIDDGVVVDATAAFVVGVVIF